MLCVRLTSLLLVVWGACMMLARSSYSGEESLLGMLKKLHQLKKEWQRKVVENEYEYRIDVNRKVWLEWELERPKGRQERGFDAAFKEDPQSLVDASTRIFFRVAALIDSDDVIGVGFSEHGELTNADLAVQWTDEDGVKRFQDTHTDDFGNILVDRQQNYHLHALTERASGWQVLEFSRLVNPCDPHDYVIDTGTTNIIVFTLAGRQRHITYLNFLQLHPSVIQTQLLKPNLPTPALPQDVRVLEVTVEKVTVPAVETTYWCSVQRLPPMPSKHHIVKFEAIISDETRDIVHHLEVFACSRNTIASSAPCGDKASSCSKVIAAWAMGAQALTYPIEAGFPIGGGNSPSHVMVQLHYNNPQRLQNLKDSSGMRFYLTKQLRRNEVGVMEVGLEYTDKMALPPSLNKWFLKGYCTAECTRAALPPEGIMVFASQLHTHLTGVRVVTKHIRNGVELPELNRDDHYTPNFQEIRTLASPVHVLPSDVLITICEDSTRDRKNVTMVKMYSSYTTIQGGFAISDEMCVNYLHYYPSVDLEVCKSSVTTASLMAFFEVLKKRFGDPVKLEMGISDNYKAISWDSEKVELLERFYHQAPLSMQCNRSDGQRFQGEWENIKVPLLDISLVKNDMSCS